MKMYGSLPLNSVRIKDAFWSGYDRLVREVMIPYQWDALNDNVPDAEPSGAVRNFRIAAGLEQGEFHGLVFQDSDLAKWLEAVGYSLQTHPDAGLERIADGVIELIEKAQQKDGYLNTYFTVLKPGERWTNLWECHELYCAGHLIEAAAAYFEATGKRKLLDIVCRLADHVYTVFGSEPGKLKGYDGHEEIELALVKLYRVTGEERYLRLSRYFIDERGKEPYFYDMEWEKRGRTSYWTGGICDAPGKSRDYVQAHLPVREQTDAVGHSVRAVYLYSAMADIALETGDTELAKACRRLWDSIVEKRIYITGGIGTTGHGEAFTFDYDLPNDTAYAETCAAIGFIFFSYRMLLLEAKSKYADEIERALYNGFLSGLSTDGTRFFYVNPLEVWPEACLKDPGKKHVKPVRQKWFGCACCPPNAARLLASLGRYVYTVADDTVYTHLYIGGEADINFKGGTLKLTQETSYPWDGKISLYISAKKAMRFKLGLRIPGWCKKYHLDINGTTEDTDDRMADGYVMLEREWKDGDRVTLDLVMPVELMQSNPLVRENAGRVAIQRGPLIYCLEETDNGKNLSAISISLDSKLSAEIGKDPLDRTMIIKVEALRRDESGWGDTLYRSASAEEVPVKITAVPYYIWGNREPGEMLVWIRQA